MSRVYTDAQQVKRREKLLLNLMKKAEAEGKPFVPQPGGPLEALWKEKGFDKLPKNTA